MPINTGMDEDTPLTTNAQVTESETIGNENVDSKMTEADVANSTNEHDSFPNPITFNCLPPRSINSFDEMALEFICLLDEAKTALNKMLNESTDLDELINKQYFITIVRHIPSPNFFRRTIKRDTNSIVKHDICVNGCFMYPTDESNMKTCPNEECGEKRYCNEAEVQAAMDDIDRDDNMPLPELTSTR
ncbi:hypothetical protein EDC96DRAFT_538892 [Choanephora cucurbitarum]|nr:hypothetical protein EDC96DRAFT_538892 [Choanephora cucurbitarum]